MNTTRKQGYEKSTVGWVPSTWKVKPLGQVSTECKIRNNGKIDDKLLCGVLKNQGLVPMRERVKGVSTDRCKVVVPNAFAYNPMRLNIGSIARNTDQHTVMVSPDYVVFATDPLQLLPNYLDQVRRSGLWERYVGASGDGSVRVRIYYEHLARLEIPIPPIPEQQKIASILTDVDCKLDIIARQIKATQTLKRGLMHTLFSRGAGTQNANGRWVPHTEFKDSELGWIPAAWLDTSIGKIGELKNGINKPKEAFGSGNAFVNLMDVFGKSSVRKGCFGLVETSEKEREDFCLKQGDILFVRSSVKPSGVGLTSLIEEKIPDAVYSGFLIRLRLTGEGCLPEYLKHYFLSDSFRTALMKKSTVSANTNINQVALSSLPVLVPSKSEQEYIANTLDLCDEKLAVLSEKIERYQNIKRGLMQKLLTGEWRVTLDTQQEVALAA